MENQAGRQVTQTNLQIINRHFASIQQLPNHGDRFALLDLRRTLQTNLERWVIKTVQQSRQQQQHHERREKRPQWIASNGVRPRDYPQGNRVAARR